MLHMHGPKRFSKRDYWKNKDSAKDTIGQQRDHWSAKETIGKIRIQQKSLVYVFKRMFSVFK